MKQIDVSGPDDVKVAYDFAKRPESALLSKILGYRLHLMHAGEMQS